MVWGRPGSEPMQPEGSRTRSIIFFEGVTGRLRPSRPAEAGHRARGKGLVQFPVEVCVQVFWVGFCPCLPPLQPPPRVPCPVAPTGQDDTCDFSVGFIARGVCAEGCCPTENLAGRWGGSKELGEMGGTWGCPWPGLSTQPPLLGPQSLPPPGPGLPLLPPPHEGGS